MNLIEADIPGDDYVAAGKGSKSIKAFLVQVGIDSAIVRKAMVAVYEAEMNVAIHAGGGKLKAVITEDMLEVTIEDKGPGIPDIEKAMVEGYSTAPAKAREFGFGAGMGLPNIRRNTDRFTLTSAPGQGTIIRFSVYLKENGSEVMATMALTVHADKCTRCLKCLHACPTQAIRLYPSGPEILPHLCVNCTACMASCASRVFDFDAGEVLPDYVADRIACFPDPLLGQFPLASPQSEPYNHIMKSLGTFLLENRTATLWMDPYFEYYCRHFKSNDFKIAPICPAIINLIQLRYPSLLNSVLPMISPLESVRSTNFAKDIIFVPSCPAEYAIAREKSALNAIYTVHPRVVVNTMMRNLDFTNATVPVVPPILQNRNIRVISGMNRVCEFLDLVENGNYSDCGLCALYACDGACYGSPVWNVPPAIAAQRVAHYSNHCEDETVFDPLFRLKPLAPRAGARLDPDMKTAMIKLSKINQISKTLPGYDCGACGSPSCLAHAEDMVIERMPECKCPFLSPV